jgi:endonuclease/exonuclease/phosphatase family metal-dependent hydrolase
MEADLDIDGEVLKVMITHLSIKEKERPEQVNFITKKLEEVSQPKILMGDFNNNPSSEIIKQITAVMKDTAIKEYNTFPANNPKKRTDYIFVSDKIKVKSSQSVMSEASDHLPVVAELVLQQTED